MTKMSEEKKNPVGRPQRELTEEELKDLKILSVTCTLDEIADYFGICRETFRQMRIRDELISSHYKKGLVKSKGMVGNKIFKKAVVQDDLMAMMYWMNHRGGWLKEAKDGDNTDNFVRSITVNVKQNENLEQLEQLESKKQRMASSKESGSFVVDDTEPKKDKDKGKRVKRKG